MMKYLYMILVLGFHFHNDFDPLLQEKIKIQYNLVGYPH